LPADVFPVLSNHARRMTSLSEAHVFLKIKEVNSKYRYRPDDEILESCLQAATSHIRLAVVQICPKEPKLRHKLNYTKIRCQLDQ
jgi:hypothetical protein